MNGVLPVVTTGTFSLPEDAAQILGADFGGNAIHRFDPETQAFETFALPHSNGSVRQLLGRAGEVWGAESAVDQIVVIRF